MTRDELELGIKNWATHYEGDYLGTYLGTDNSVYVEVYFSNALSAALFAQDVTSDLEVQTALKHSITHLDHPVTIVAFRDIP